MRRAPVVVVLGVLCMAPTPGDVGGCGAEVTALDRDRFAAARKREDCLRCAECGLTTPRCARACDPKKAPETAIPASCLPLQHDGEACLRALDAASCDAYATYVDEARPVTPSECGFCKVEPPSPPSFTADAPASERAP